jgi:hypothetical protein
VEAPERSVCCRQAAFTRQTDAITAPHTKSKHTELDEKKQGGYSVYMARKFNVGFLDIKFFSGLGGYSTMSETEREEKRVLFDIADKKTQRRWWKKYLELATSAEAHKAAIKFASPSRGRRRTAEQKLLGI